MTVRGRFIVVFVVGALAALASGLVLWLLGIVSFDDRPPAIASTAAIVVTVLLASVALAIIERNARRFDAEALALVNAVRALAAGKKGPGLSDGTLREFHLIYEAAAAIRDQLGMVTSQLESLSAQVVKSTGEAEQSCGEVDAGSAAQSEMTGRGADALGKLAKAIGDASDRIDALSRRVDKSVAHALRIDSGLGQASETAAKLAANLAQAGANAKEGDKAIRAAAKELSDLASGVKLTEGAIGEMISGARVAQGDAVQAASAVGKLELETGKMGAALAELIRGSDAARASNVRILDVTAALSSRVDRMDDVIAVIRDLADRTKLLSINASIIASEAGEHGRAFAVVAREIKELAQSTTGAISEISHVVSGLKEGFSQTVDTVLKGQTDVQEGIASAENAAQLLRAFPSEVQGAAAWNRKIEKHTVDQVARGVQIEESAASLAASMEQVRRILSAQLAQNDDAVALFYAIAASADEVVKSIKECASLLGEVNPTTEAAVAEFRDLSQSGREHLASLGDLLAMSKEILSITEANRKQTAGLSVLLNDLNRYAYYLGEDFRKKGLREPA